MMIRLTLLALALVPLPAAAQPAAEAAAVAAPAATEALAGSWALKLDGAIIFRFMSRGYSQLLERIAATGVDSLHCRVRLSHVQKLKLAVGAWANRWRA